MKRMNICKTLNSIALPGGTIMATSALAQTQGGSGYGMGSGMMGGDGAGWMGSGYGGIWGESCLSSWLPALWPISCVANLTVSSLETLSPPLQGGRNKFHQECNTTLDHDNQHTPTRTAS